MAADVGHSFGGALAEADIRGLIRMMGEISGLEEAMPRKKELLLSNLCALIKGDGWAWSLTEQRGDRVICLDALSGGDQSTVAKRKPSFQPKAVEPALAGAGKGLTLAICELAGNIESRMVFGRRAKRPAFSEREEEMARIVAEEVGWLHELKPVCTPLHSEVHLSARQRETFILLAQGLSHKEIADRLGISPHTEHDYVKALYRIFGIKSRAELIKLSDLHRPK